MAIANGSPFYMPPSILREFEDELSTVMLFFSIPGDLIIKERPVSKEFQLQLAELNLPSPGFICSGKMRELITKGEKTNYIASSWGNSPAETNFLQKSGITPQHPWNKNLQKLYERETSANFLKRIIEDFDDPLFPDMGDMPKKIETAKEIEDLLKEDSPIVIKAPLSSSGRGLQIIRKPHLNQANKQWIDTTIKQQQYLIAEKWHQKLLDFSFQFYIAEDHQVKYLGTSFFNTNTSGQYLGHHINYQEKNRLPVSLKVVDQIGKKLGEKLFDSYYGKHHTGYIGIDAMIYKEGDKIKLHPCLEVNPRYTMGILSKFIETHIPPNATGIFNTYFDQKRTYYEFARDKNKKNPPKKADSLFNKGFLSITDPVPESRFGAYIELF